METTVMHNRIEQERGSQQRGRRSPWALPHDPSTNARPPGNGDLDRRATDNSRERLMAVLGR
jgi:hypothetical protein